MKQLDKEYRNMLKALALKVQGDLKIFDRRIITIDRIAVEQSATFGWFVDIFRFKGISGKVQLWIDLFPNVGRPILSVSYDNGDLERIKKIANSTKLVFEKNYLSTDNLQLQKYSRFVLDSPLLKKEFGKFLIEKYTNRENYYVQYFYENIDAKNKQLLVLKKLIKNVEWLLRSIVSALEVGIKSDEDYTAIENRQIVAIHRRRERSKKLADKAKFRDGFKCQVCNFSFADTYGDLGNEFAEAHHIVALAKLKDKIQTTHNDLITVCSNCHRMLHKMEGLDSDYRKLRRIIKKNGMLK